MISDVPGYTWGIVPVLAQAGVKYFSIGPNECDRIGRTLAGWGDKIFYWRSPSGQERVLCWMANGYSFFHGAFGGGTLGEKGPKRLLAKLDGLERAGYPYDLVQLRYSIGGDNGPPDPNLSDFVRKWNDTYLSPHLVISTVTEMFAAFEQRYGDRIPEVTGDFTPYWEDGAGSSARETALNRETAERLVQTETLFALLAPEKFPAADFAAAWRNAILYDEHTWGAWNSISEPDEPFVKEQWKVKQAYALDAANQSQHLLAQTVGALPSSGAAVTAVDVYNTSSWTRTDLVTLPKDLATAGDAVKDSAGVKTPSQRLSTGELAFLAKDVPPFASVRYSFSPDAAEGSGEAFADGTTLRTPQIRVRVDAKTGAIVSLRDAAGKELVDSQAGVAVNDYRYMLDDVAGAKGAGPARVSVKEAGPLVAALLIESDAPAAASSRAKCA
jgi:alpha-mannosidase